MTIRRVGHTWNAVPGVAPCLLSAMEGFESYAGASRRITHPCWVLDYSFTEYGVYRVVSPRRRWRQRQHHTGHLYPPGTSYWEDLREGGGTEMRHCYVTFSGGDEAGLASLVPAGEGYARFEDPTDRLGETIVRAARVGLEHGERGFWLAQSILCEIIDLLHSCGHAGEETYAVPDPNREEEISFAEKVDDYLREHSAERLTLAGIARHLHVSPSTLSHRYRQEAGRSPMKRLIEIRIGMAKGLLFRGYPLKTIAEQTGFSDMYHLSKTFKRQEGVSPRAFLRGDAARS